MLCLISPKASRDISTGRVVFKAAKGTGKIGRLILSERSTACRIIVVLDGDAAGESRAERLHSEGVLDRKSIFVLRDSSRNVSEIEDLLEPSFYVPVLKECFGRSFSAGSFENPNVKWSDNFLHAAGAVGLAGGGELVSDAKTAICKAVSRESKQPLKESAMGVMKALGEAIWPD